MIEFDLPPPLPEPPPAPPPPDADIPQEAFGARQAASPMPESIDDPLYRREAATANATRAEELNNDFIGRQREILQTGPDAFYNRQGRDAILAAPEMVSTDTRRSVHTRRPTRHAKPLVVSVTCRVSRTIRSAGEFAIRSWTTMIGQRASTRKRTSAYADPAGVAVAHDAAVGWVTNRPV